MPTEQLSRTDKPTVAVIVAAYNEEKFILDTLRALDKQRWDDVIHRDVLGSPRVIVVDNNSTDRTADIVAEHIQSHPRFPVELITEKQKGLGYAIDTAARHAIDTGATLVARTDADTIPDTEWLSQLIRPLLDGKRLVGGRLRARTDEGFTNVVFNAIGVAWRLGHGVEWWRTRKEPDALRRSFAVCGPNLAFDADIYRESGGFPRVSMDDADEDIILQRRVRAITGSAGIGLAQKAVVYISLRRLHAFGIKDFVTWYSTKDRDTTGKQVDVR
ncbi:glycosyltransferase [Williamsia maris]|uniref:Glycosyl transferase family 2 n=1 Tax=Williamsia maris TaxID=72806 RepID=A0ABT1HF03_9NOCA|nr:glycosyltransferase family 2 protein [Williamsia maris]MCP2175456.1 Glycosyl transferase family 2 [Williamsia maris]